MKFHSFLAAAALAVAASAEELAQNEPTAHGPAVPLEPAEPAYNTSRPESEPSQPAQSTSALPSDPSTKPAPYAPDYITAHHDAQCQNGLKKENGRRVNNRFVVTKKFPEYETMPFQTFPGAEPTGNTGGWNVWWDIPQPPETCRYIVMVPYSTREGTVNQPAGNEIINVGKQGCYFGAIPVKREFYMSMCCGDQCNGPASLQSASLLSYPKFGEGSDPSQAPETKQPTPEEQAALQAANPQQGPVQPSAGASAPAASQAAPVDPAQQQPANPAQAAAQAAGQQIPQPPQRRSAEEIEHLEAVFKAFQKRNDVSTRGSPAAKAKALVSRWWYDAPAPPPVKECHATPGGQRFSRSGPQTIISQSQVCSTTPCSVGITYTANYATSISSRHDTTLTNGGSFSVGITAGENLIFETKITTTFGYTFSRAVTESTGKDITQGTSIATANNLAFMPGQREVVTFTPLLDCVTSEVHCDTGEPVPYDFCQPVMTGQGNQQMPTGDYNVLVLDY